MGWRACPVAQPGKNTSGDNYSSTELSSLPPWGKGCTVRVHTHLAEVRAGAGQAKLPFILMMMISCGITHYPVGLTA